MFMEFNDVTFNVDMHSQRGGPGGSGIPETGINFFIKDRIGGTLYYAQGEVTQQLFVIIFDL